MHICLLTPRFPPDVGGVAQANERLALSLQAQGHRVSVVVAHEGEPWAAVTYALPERLRDPDFWRTHRQTHGWDLLHGYYLSSTGEPGGIAQMATGCPLILSARGNDLDRDIWMPERRERLLKSLQSATHLTGVTRELTHKAHVLSGGVPSTYVPNSVASELFVPGPGHLPGIPPEARVLAFFGEARQKKGLPLLLQAFQQFAALYADIHLALVGGVRPGPDTDMVRIFQRQQPALSARLHVFPYLRGPELIAAYNRADLVLFPSYQEGMANACLEAMACARPIIATTVGGFPDLITHQQEGYLIPPYQLEPLLQGIQTLLTDATVGRQWGAAARKRVVQDFTPAQEYTRLLAIYQALI